jgi:ABC-type cobalamin/Fe3+-siderophores transport system ATPase subunit
MTGDDITRLRALSWINGISWINDCCKYIMDLITDEVVVRSRYNHTVLYETQQKNEDKEKIKSILSYVQRMS